MNEELRKCIIDWLSFFDKHFSDVADLQAMKDMFDHRLPTYKGSLKATTKELIDLIDARIKELIS